MGSWAIEKYSSHLTSLGFCRHDKIELISALVLTILGFSGALSSSLIVRLIAVGLVVAIALRLNF